MKIGLPRARIAGVSARRTLHVLLLPLLCFVFSAAWAAALEDVRNAFSDAHAGKKDLDAAVSMIDAYCEQNQDSPVAIAYKGSIRTIQGAKGTAPWKKMAYMNEGFSLLDKAVSLLSAQNHAVTDSVAVEVLLISGITNASVPKLFKRRPVAKLNLEALLSRKGFHQLNSHSQAQAYAWLAVLAHDEDAARSADYLARARRLNGQAAEEIWSKK